MSRESAGNGRFCPSATFSAIVGERSQVDYQAILEMVHTRENGRRSPRTRAITELTIANLLRINMHLTPEQIDRLTQKPLYTLTYPPDPAE